MTLLFNIFKKKNQLHIIELLVSGTTCILKEAGQIRWSFKSLSKSGGINVSKAEKGECSLAESSHKSHCKYMSYEVKYFCISNLHIWADTEL